MSRTVYQLNAEYRWCLTGTPTQNSIEDLYSLIKFLKFMPWASRNWWQIVFPKNIRNIQI
jgi:DNA repair protein RAD5